MIYIDIKQWSKISVNGRTEKDDVFDSRDSPQRTESLTLGFSLSFFGYLVNLPVKSPFNLPLRILIEWVLHRSRIIFPSLSRV